MKRKNTKGFTLMEMMIVVAIIAILIAVMIPTFSAAKEKAARATDMANARAIESMLSSMVALGDIEFPTRENAKAADIQYGIGIYVIVCRDEDHAPGGYKNNASALKLGEGIYCGANKGVEVNGFVSSDWNRKFPALEEVVKSCFSDEMMKSFSDSEKNVKGLGGWDWYAVEFSWDYDKNEGKSRIYSGMAGEESGIKKITHLTNIESAMGRTYRP